ncbi:hypothetical protein HZ326_14356 [Fusarium oxysporum f. sp. albedinis]|nr:hypothetical protein HZ326_14356 [Fusarium oxysporum f. sp. albedinis]
MALVTESEIKERKRCRMRSKYCDCNESISSEWIEATCFRDELVADQSLSLNSRLTSRYVGSHRGTIMLLALTLNSRVHINDI